MNKYSVFDSESLGSGSTPDYWYDFLSWSKTAGITKYGFVSETEIRVVPANFRPCRFVNKTFLSTLDIIRKLTLCIMYIYAYYKSALRCTHGRTDLLTET